MPTIEFRKTHKPIEVQHGANLMKALQNAKIPVASSCNGDGVCCKCIVTVLRGMENLSGQNDVEVFLKEKNELDKLVRVSCQVHIFGDILIDAGYW